jgi:predicted nucleotidyltransferase
MDKMVQGELPLQVSKTLDEIAAKLKIGLGDQLRSIVLFGSAAEGRIRVTSDVNLLVVITMFDVTRMDPLREFLRTAQAAIQLEPMFVLESELPQAMQTFAVKFTDIQRRHKILFGSNPFSSLSVSRQATIDRLKQVLLNLTLRLRTVYVLRSLREEQLALSIADVSGPLRAAAAAICELEERKTSSPKEALHILSGRFSGSDWTKVLEQISQARENRHLPPGQAANLFQRVMEMCGQILEIVNRLV